MKFALFAIVILATASSMTLMEKYPLNFSQNRSIMNLMVQIEAQIKAGGPYDAIIQILDEFEKGIKDEQAQHDELHKENQESCAEELEFRQNAIREADQAIREATNTLDGCQQQLARAESDRKAAENQLASARQTLGTVERERLAEHEIFIKNDFAYKALLNGIDEALAIIEQLKSGNASFIQMAKHTNKMMLNAAQTKSISNLAGVMAALVEVQNKDVNTEAIFQKLNALFVGFQEETAHKKQAAIDAENASVAHYNTVKQRLTTTINKLVEQIAALEAEILELRKCISVQQGILASAKAKFTRNTQLFNSATSLCERDNVNYEHQKVARRDELELLVAIKQRVHERFADISNEHGTIDRASMDNEEIVNSYNNASAYDNQTFQG